MNKIKYFLEEPSQFLKAVNIYMSISGLYSINTVK